MQYISRFHFSVNFSSMRLKITWPPTCPLLSRYRSVCDHEDSLQGLIVESTVEKFTVFSLLWINFRIFQGRSLWLKWFQKELNSSVAIISFKFVCNVWFKILIEFEIEKTKVEFLIASFLLFSWSVFTIYK